MSQALQPLLNALPIGSLDAYIHQVNRIPMLSLEEEQAYATNYQTNGDVESARKLVLAHLRYVVKVARGYLGYGLPLNDLIQEGNMGLMKAVKRFDPKVGVRLVSFAVHWIKAEIHEFVLKNWRIVKVATTKAQRKLFFNLRQMKNKTEPCSAEETHHVAELLGVKPETVKMMEERLGASDVSYDLSPSDDENSFAPEAWIRDDRSNPLSLLEAEQQHSNRETGLHLALEELDARSRDIIERRWLNEDDKVTLQDLAATYGISAERVRQLEKNAMEKLRHFMKKMKSH